MTTAHTINKIPAIFIFFILKATYRLAELTEVEQIHVAKFPQEKVLIWETRLDY